MQPTDSPARGGAATPDRQCQFIKSNGFRCEDWALRGHQHCFRHHQYLNSCPETPIDVPLLDDEDDLVSLLSQTLRALALGTIPVANGRAILAGCRVMQGILTRRLAQAKFHVKLTSLNSPEASSAAADSLFGPRPPAQPPAETHNPQPEPRNPQPVTRTPQPATRNPQPEPRNPQPVPRPDQPLNPFVIPQGVPDTAFAIEQLLASQGSVFNAPRINP